MVQASAIVAFILVVLFVHLVFYPQEVRIPYSEKASLKSTMDLFRFAFLLTAPFLSLLTWTHSAYSIYLRLWLFISKFMTILAISILLIVHLENSYEFLIVVLFISFAMTPNSLAFIATIKVKLQHERHVLPSIYSVNGICHKN